MDSKIFVKVRPIEVLRFQSTDNGGCRYVSDVNLLMNAERIRNTLGEDNYLNIIRSINPTRSAYEKGKFTDEQLLNAIKSRYLQSPSEMNAWINSLLKKKNQLDDEVKAAVEEYQAKMKEVEIQKQEEPATKIE